MIGPSEREQLRQLCKDYCTVNAADGQVPDGYFRIDGGEKARRVKVVAAQVDWSGDPEAALSTLIKRVEMASREHRLVYVRAIPRGGSHPAASVTIEGRDDGTTEPDEDAPPTGPNALMEAFARVTLAQQREREALYARLDNAHETRIEVEVQRAMYAMVAHASENSRGSEMMGKALESMGPPFVAALPELLSALGALMRPAPPPPPPRPSTDPSSTTTEPTDTPTAIRQYVDDIVNSVTSLSERLRSDPAGAVGSRADLMRLRALVVNLAPYLGISIATAEDSG